MAKIFEIMDPRCIQLELTARSKKDAIRELVRLLVDAGRLGGGVERYVAEVMEREVISSTGIGRGIAIPHRLVKTGAEEIVMAVGRSERGVPFESVDGKPAHLIFLIIGPAGQSNDYLKTLGSLSCHLNDRIFFETLMRVGGADEVVELVREREC
jgi:mannitol/fructose-specific phosphotransferase system IIA component (Ntr-type)